MEASNEQGFVAAAKEMAEKFVAAVQAAGISAEEPYHPGDEVRARGFSDEMKMIGHEAPGVDLPAGLGAGFADGLEEEFAVFVAEEDGLAAVDAVHDVINRSRELDAQFSGHTRNRMKGTR